VTAPLRGEAGTRFGLVARARRWGLVDVPAASARPVAGAGPRRPEDHRDHEADCADDHQDPSDRVFVDAAHAPGDAPDQDGTGGDQNQAYSNTHSSLLSGPSSWPAAALYPRGLRCKQPFVNLSATLDMTRSIRACDACSQQASGPRIE